jgi:hypothetical protein
MGSVSDGQEIDRLPTTLTAPLAGSGRWAADGMRRSRAARPHPPCRGRLRGPRARGGDGVQPVGTARGRRPPRPRNGNVTERKGRTFGAWHAQYILPDMAAADACVTKDPIGRLACRAVEGACGG